jgi:hypothetical protein
MKNWCICWLTARRPYKSFGVKGLLLTVPDTQLFAMQRETRKGKIDQEKTEIWVLTVTLHLL